MWRWCCWWWWESAFECVRAQSTSIPEWIWTKNMSQIHTHIYDMLCEKPNTVARINAAHIIHRGCDNKYGSLSFCIAVLCPPPIAPVRRTFNGVSLVCEDLCSVFISHLIYIYRWRHTHNLSRNFVHHVHCILSLLCANTATTYYGYCPSIRSFVRLLPLSSSPSSSHNSPSYSDYITLPFSCCFPFSSPFFVQLRL